jgi:hypothetical protein
VGARVQRIESGALRYLMSDEIDPAVFADLWSRLQPLRRAQGQSDLPSNPRTPAPPGSAHGGA